jgi:hypothetical protein
MPFSACGQARPAQSGGQYDPRPTQASVTARAHARRLPCYGHVRGSAVACSLMARRWLELRFVFTESTTMAWGRRWTSGWKQGLTRSAWRWWGVGDGCNSDMLGQWTTSGSWHDPGSGPVAQGRTGARHAWPNWGREVVTKGAHREGKKAVVFGQNMRRGRVSGNLRPADADKKLG